MTKLEDVLARRTSLRVLWILLVFVYSFNESHEQVDMTTALVFSLNDRNVPKSYLAKLFGNPNDYAWKLANSSDTSSLPIHYNSIHIGFADFVRPVTVDYRTARAFFGSNGAAEIHFGYYVYNNNTVLYTYAAQPRTNQMNGLAYDWLSSYMFYTDGEFKLVAALRVADRYWKPVVDSNLTAPQDVVVNPIIGYLFWSDGTGVNAKIERSDMGGNNRRVLMTSSHGLISPTTLVIEFSSQKLYWLDAGASKVGLVNFDGTQRSVVQRSAFAQFSTMAVYQSFVYFGDSAQPQVHIYSKSSFTPISTYMSTATGTVVDMTMFAAESQPSPTTDNPCRVSNGGCSQFCFTTSSTTKVCQCAAGFFLGDDGRTCTTRTLPPFTNFLLVADYHQKNIFQIQSESDELRALLTTRRSSPSALTFDTGRRTVYMTCEEMNSENNNNNQYRIRKLSLDGKTDSIIYYSSDASAKLAGITLDSGRGLLYFTDKYLGLISVIAVDGSAKRDLLNDPLRSPFSIVVDPRNRLLYWTDCCVTSKGSFCSNPATIGVMNADDGSGAKTLYSDYTHQCISGLAIDFNTRTMYWSSVSNSGRGVIEKAHVDGTGKTTLLTELHVKYTRVTLGSDSLYISDSKRRNIVRFNLTTNTLSDQLPPLFANIQDVKFISYSTAPDEVSTKSAAKWTSSSKVYSTHGEIPPINSTGLLDTQSHTGDGSSTAAVTRQPTPVTETSDLQNIVIIAAAAGGGVLLIVIILVITGVVCCYKMMKKKHRTPPGESEDYATIDLTPTAEIYSEIEVVEEETNKGYEPLQETGTENSYESFSSYEPLRQNSYYAFPPPAPAPRPNTRRTSAIRDSNTEITDEYIHVNE